MMPNDFLGGDLKNDGTTVKRNDKAGLYQILLFF